MYYVCLLQVMTMDNWPWIMYDTYNARGGFSFALFPLVIVLGMPRAAQPPPRHPYPYP